MVTQVTLRPLMATVMMIGKDGNTNANALSIKGNITQAGNIEQTGNINQTGTIKASGKVI